MRLLEHQGKTLLAGFDLRFNAWMVANTPAEALAAVEATGFPVVLKGQVPSGGRAKAGAVQFAANLTEAKQAIDRLFAMSVGAHPIRSLSVEKKRAFVSELYVGVTWDAAAKLPLVLVVKEGGIHVESTDAGMVGRRTFDPRVGLSPFEGRMLGAQLGLKGRTLVQLGDVLANLCRAFLATDAVVAEINPLVESEPDGLIGLDAHVEIEDDALFRQMHRLKPLGELVSTAHGRAPTPLELSAQRIDAMDHRGVAGRLVEFDGDLALLIGGGGASLTVFDAIRRYGGRPANYCEIGGNPTETKVAALTTLLLSKPGVTRLAVIMNVVNNTRADVIARGVVQGVTEAGRKPSETISVFRVPGSWETEAAQIMEAAGIKVQGRDCSLDLAARIAVEEAKSHAR